MDATMIKSATVIKATVEKIVKLILMNAQVDLVKIMENVYRDRILRSIHLIIDS